MFSIVVATWLNWEIWKDNKLLWHIPEDLKRFKEITLNKNVLMWKNTYNSIISILWKPLPKRTNIVLSRTLWKYDIDWFVYNDIETFLKDFKDEEVYIIWWWEIYKKFISLDCITNIYLTLVKKEYKDADTFFYFDKDKFSLINKEEFLDYDFLLYRKK